MHENPTIATAFADLEASLFATDGEATARAGAAFVRENLPPARPRTRTDRYLAAARVPGMPGTYARHGGETTIVRSNDAALALARRGPAVGRPADARRAASW